MTTRTISPYEKMQEQRKRRDENSKKVWDLACRAGLVLTQVSPRRFVVVEFNTTNRRLVFHNGEAVRRVVYLCGETVFGPATHAECSDYIQTRAAVIPPENYDC